MLNLLKNQNSGTMTLLWLGYSGIVVHELVDCRPAFFLLPPSSLISQSIQNGQIIVNSLGMMFPIYHHCPEYLTL
jgi:hypothetical protein